MNESARVNEHTCPYCGAVHDRVSNHTNASGTNRRIPQNDDYSICIICAQPSRYIVSTLGISLRPLTEQELIQLPAEIAMHCQLMLEIHKQLGRPPR